MRSGGGEDGEQERQRERDRAKRAVRVKRKDGGGSFAEKRRGLRGEEEEGGRGLVYTAAYRRRRPCRPCRPRCPRLRVLLSPAGTVGWALGVGGHTGCVYTRGARSYAHVSYTDILLSFMRTVYIIYTYGCIYIYIRFRRAFARKIIFALLIRQRTHARARSSSRPAFRNKKKKNATPFAPPYRTQNTRTRGRV